METEGNLLQKMKNVFSDNEDKEKLQKKSLKKYWKAMKRCSDKT